MWNIDIRLAEAAENFDSFHARRPWRVAHFEENDAQTVNVHFAAVGGFTSGYKYSTITSIRIQS